MDEFDDHMTGGIWMVGLGKQIVDIGGGKMHPFPNGLDYLQFVLPEYI